MSTDNNGIDNNGSTEGGALRKQYEEALAKLKERDEKIAAFEAKERTQGLEASLSGKGLNPKLAGLVPADVASDPARLDAWLNDYADVFTPASNGGDDAGAGAAGGQPNASAGEQAAWRQIQGASANGTQPVVDQAALVAQINGATSPDELLNLLKANGM